MSHLILRASVLVVVYILSSVDGQKKNRSDRRIQWLGLFHNMRELEESI